MARCNCETRYFEPEKSITKTWLVDEEQYNNIKNIIFTDFEIWLSNLYNTYLPYDNSRQIDLPGEEYDGSIKKCYYIDRGSYKIENTKMNPDSDFIGGEMPEDPPEQTAKGTHSCPDPIQMNAKCDCVNTKGGNIDASAALDVEYKTVKKETIDEKTIPIDIEYSADVVSTTELGCKGISSSPYSYNKKSDTQTVKDSGPSVSVRIYLEEEIKEYCLPWSKKHKCP